MRKFYHTINASKPVTVAGLSIAFTSYEIVGGSWYGIYATDLPAEHAALDKAARQPRSGVTAIPGPEYEAALKKKRGPRPVTPVFDPRQPLMSQYLPPAVAANRPEVLDYPIVQPERLKPAVNVIEDDLELGAVEPSQPIAPKRRRNVRMRTSSKHNAPEED